MVNFAKALRDSVSSFLSKTARIWPDKFYITAQYLLRMRRLINWKNPRTFNEKQNWLKIYNRNPYYTKLADKYEVKSIVSSIIGEKYVVPCLGVWDSIDDVDFSKLPDEFVIKATHDSSGATVCRKPYNIQGIITKYKKIQKRNYFYQWREWPYRDITPRIIADTFLSDGTGTELRDYKFWCFNGTPTYMYCTIKGKDVYENFYDMSFNPIMIDHGIRRHPQEFLKPSKFDEMKELASKLSKNIPFVRIDFFQVGERVYFGEFTFYDWAGMNQFRNGWDEELGKLISLESFNND